MQGEESSEGEPDSDYFDKSLGTKDIASLSCSELRDDTRKYVWKISSTRDAKRSLLVAADSDDEMRAWLAAHAAARSSLDKL